MLSIKLNNLLSIFTFLCFCLVNITHSFDIRKGIYNRWITSKAMSQIKENLIYKKSHNLKKSKIIDDILKTIHLSQNNPIIKQQTSLELPPFTEDPIWRVFPHLQVFPHMPEYPHTCGNPT